MRIPDILNAPWAILPEKLEIIQEVYLAHLEGRIADTSQLVAAIKENQAQNAQEDEERGYTIEAGVAIIPIQGVISRRMNMFSLMSGGESTELLLKKFNAALNDREVEAILFDTDSPGGAIGGLAPLSDAIYNARGKKPMVAFAGDLMASAAYWITSAVDCIVAESTSKIGSIGVVTVHREFSKANEQRGVKETYITAGKYKALGNDSEPLSPEAREYIQDSLNYYCTIFIDAVSRNRGLSIDTIADWADGKIFIGQRALDAGLIDSIGTLGDAWSTALIMIDGETQYLIRR